MAEGDQSGVENDNNFIGFASRLDPANLKPGVLQSSRNMRLQRGTAQPRKGCERMTDDTLNTLMQSGSGYYVNTAGEDNVVLLFTDGMVLYNTQRQTFSAKYTFPTGRYLPIGTLTTQIPGIFPTTIPQPAPPLGQPYTQWINVQTTIGINVGDKIKIGSSTSNPNVTYYEYDILQITGTEIYYALNLASAYPLPPVNQSAVNTPVSVILPSFSFEPEIVQALDKLYIFRGLPGPKITATVTNPQVQNGNTIAVTVTTATPHGLRVGSEVNLIDTVTPYQHPYFHANFIVETVPSTTQFTFQFTNTTGSTIQAHTNITGFLAQQANPPLVWDGVSGSLSFVDQTGVDPSGTYPLPPAEFGLYFQNRIVVKTDDTQMTATDILSDRYDPLNVYTINQGGYDSIVGALPWIENQFLLFLSKSIYIAFIDPRFDPTAPDRSQITVVTTEVGCLARHSIVPAGQFVFFFSGKGIHMLTPQLDLKVLGNTLPLSEPIDDYFDNVNFDYARKVTATYFDNRFFIAFPTSEAVKNNSILVYNTLNQAWESIDTYPDGMYIDNFIPALYNNKRRLFIVSDIGKPTQVPLSGPIAPGQPSTFLAGAYGGIFLAEQLESGDEFLGVTGTPILPFTLPATINSLSYILTPIAASVRTREYGLGTQATKRYSRAELQFTNNPGDDVSVFATVYDPDSTEEVLRYVFAGSGQSDGTIRPRIAMKGVGIDLQVNFNTGRPSLRSASVYAIQANRGMITEE